MNIGHFISYHFLPLDTIREYGNEQMGHELNGMQWLTRK